MRELNKEFFVELKKQVLKLEKAGEIEKVLNHKTLYQRLRDVALDKPDAPAILYFGNKITYRELLKLIDDAALGFSEMGVKYNDVVTTSMLGTPYSIVTLYALDKLGATMHTVNCAANIEEVKRELSHYDSKFFVANDIFYNKTTKEALENAGIEKVVTISLTDGIPKGFNACTMDRLKYEMIEKLKAGQKKYYDGENVFRFNELLNIGRKSKLNIKEAEFVPDKIAIVAYTSGSTGQCKAVEASWDGLDSMVQIMGMTELDRFEESDVMFATFPLWLYYSIINMIHEPLSLGVTVALDPLFNPKDIVKRNEIYKFNHWLTIPPYIKKMTDMNKKMDCSKWKIIVTGGAELKDNVKIAADRYIRENGGSTEVAQGYGANEMLGSFSYCYYKGSSLGSMGRPCVGNMLKILDPDTGKELGPNEIGVGYMYSAARMVGYHGDEESTRHNLVTDENGATWYNSEDLIHCNENGEIFLDGRLRRMALTFDAKGNPTKLIPERTKKSISELSEVSNCEVITTHDDKFENVAVAYVVLKDGIVEDEQMKRKIIEACQMSIPEYMVPKDIVFTSNIPLNVNKKPDILLLEKMYNETKKTNCKKRLLK